MGVRKDRVIEIVTALATSLAASAIYAAASTGGALPGASARPKAKRKPAKTIAFVKTARKGRPGGGFR